MPAEGLHPVDGGSPLGRTGCLSLLLCPGPSLVLEYFLSMSSSRAKAKATNWSGTSTCQEKAAFEAGNGGFKGVLGGCWEGIGSAWENPGVPRRAGRVLGTLERLGRSTGPTHP